MKTKRYIVEIVSDGEGIHKVSLYRKSFFGKKFIQGATDTRAQNALTKAFKGLLPRN